MVSHNLNEWMNIIENLNSVFSKFAPIRFIRIILIFGTVHSNMNLSWQESSLLFLYLIIQFILSDRNRRWRANLLLHLATSLARQAPARFPWHLVGRIINDYFILVGFFYDDWKVFIYQNLTVKFNFGLLREAFKNYLADFSGTPPFR